MKLLWNCGRPAKTPIFIPTRKFVKKKWMKMEIINNNNNNTKVNVL